MNHRRYPTSLLLVCTLAACATQSEPAATADSTAGAANRQQAATVAQRMAKYTTVKLTADTSALTANERQMLPLLIDAARAMDDVFWREAYGDPAPLLSSMTDPVMRQFVVLNYGPWDRLDDNAPFVAGVGPKPKGAGYYPVDMTKAEFDSAVATGGARADSLKSLYTIVRRNAARARGCPVSCRLCSPAPAGGVETPCCCRARRGRGIAALPHPSSRCSDHGQLSAE